MSSNLQDINSARLPQDVFIQWHPVDNYQHLPVKDMAISGKIEANGYSPCQTIYIYIYISIYIVLNPMVAWGSPMTSETSQ